MPHTVTVAVAGGLDDVSGGSYYNRRMIESLTGLGWSVDVRELHGSFPAPADADVGAAARTIAGVPDGRNLVIDGLAGSALPGVLESHADRVRIVPLVHLPIAAEAGLSVETAARYRAAEQRALASAKQVIVTGAAAVGLLAPYHLQAPIVVVEPGTDAAPLAKGSGNQEVQLLSVAALTPGKGHDILLKALACVPTDTWRLVVAGSTTRHPPTAARAQALSRELGIDARVRFAGELDRDAVNRAYDAADVFVLATLSETYGMVVAEALARGLPVVSTATGAIPTLVGENAGIVVPAGDVDALAVALQRIIADQSERTRLAAGAARVRRTLPTWEDAARRFGAALEGLQT